MIRYFYWSVILHNIKVVENLMEIDNLEMKKVNFLFRSFDDDFDFFIIEFEF